MLVACSEKKAPTVTGDAKTDQKVEKAEKKLSEMTGPEKCEATWKNRYEGKLTLADVQPDFDYAEKLEGYDCFMGNGVNLAKAVYCKKDGSEITPEEWNAYITKIYNVTKKLAQDGKVVRGFGSNLDVKTPRTSSRRASIGKTPRWQRQFGMGLPPQRSLRSLLPQPHRQERKQLRQPLLRRRSPKEHGRSPQGC